MRLSDELQNLARELQVSREPFDFDEFARLYDAACQEVGPDAVQEMLLQHFEEVLPRADVSMKGKR